ncbi:putative aminodeoxychorismate synthase protein [Botrytis fragariae]|uniref:aminodeoxychorismate synthase n=1 Tax=Botrytis fragariae TaxID=1964551 RepID=A0A8H6AQ90_9HELO|nr:putative aminodeoxychorismate synthase protein [Botrytis fragariae]KAF5871375.1 putative aminodeoxychorismate synthase protein [Botrytis fragariae]
MLIQKPLILFIDAYDSFSNNIISLLETTLTASVRTVKINDPILLASDEALHEELRHYVAVVCGPGPGNPETDSDIGIIKKIWRLADEEMLPVLGICLGFQRLCLEFGGQIRRLNGPQHGMIRKVLHAGEAQAVSAVGNDSIFCGVGEITATLYQSLCIDIGQDDILDEEWNTSRWEPTEKSPDLIPLAWVESADLEAEHARSCGVKDSRVLVGVRHATKPFWAIQYHPESVCTNDTSKEIFINWFRSAQDWNKTYRKTEINYDGTMHGQSATRVSLLQQFEALQTMPVSPTSDTSTENIKPKNMCISRTIALPDNLSVPDIVEAIQDMGRDHILLESTNADETSAGSADVRGRYSIIGLDIDDCLRFEYRVGDGYVTKIPSSSGEYLDAKEEIDLKSCGGVWSLLAHRLEVARVTVGNDESPFWGGFMGYTTYELGLETIDVKVDRPDAHSNRPDLCFAWVTRSIVVDHVKKVLYLQQLASLGDSQSDTAWMEAVGPKLEKASQPKSPKSTRQTPLRPGDLVLSCDRIKVSRREKRAWSPVRTPASKFSMAITQPTADSYEAKVRRCQDKIASGDSYELCLTDQTIITRLRSDPPHTSVHNTTESILLYNKTPRPAPAKGAWSLYKNLRTRQPAPFASFLRLGAATLVSSSPEQFLKWDNRVGKCSLRPMKGTVRKTDEVTLSDATTLLNDPKEKAENLMIVDLVRHDLHGVCGSGNVSVPRLMVVEEYASVFQMISVVEGSYTKSGSDDISTHMSSLTIKDDKRIAYTGLDILAASLPPGSMTGAPKKRSCELLQDIEHHKPRSLYSGVVGYMDVGGRGDFSVTIRSMYRWDDEDGVIEAEEKDTEKWHIGAGGAVTALSTPIGERDEMLTKLNGTLGVFR